MKRIIASSLLALGAVATASAQFYVLTDDLNPLTLPNPTYLISGFGFEQLVTDGTTWNGAGFPQNSVIGYYSDTTAAGDFTPTQPAAYPARGQFYWDGTNGSSSWGQEGSFGGPGEVGSVSLFAVTVGETVGTTRRTTNGDPLFNKGLDSEGPLHVGDPNWASDVGVGFTAVAGNRFSMVLNTSGYELETMTFGGSGAGSINWFYQIGAGPLTTTGLSSSLDGTFGLKTVNLSSFFTGSETITLVGEFAGVSGGPLVTLDSFQLIGIANAIPEPSTYAALLGVACAGIALFRRRKTFAMA